MFLGEVLSVFYFFLLAFGFLYCSWLLLGFALLGYKFLLTQKKKRVVCIGSSLGNVAILSFP